jgi:hypothetical protein
LKEEDKKNKHTLTDNNNLDGKQDFILNQNPKNSQIDKESKNIKTED